MYTNNSERLRNEYRKEEFARIGMDDTFITKPIKMSIKDIMYNQGIEYAREGISLENLGELTENQSFMEGYLYEERLIALEQLEQAKNTLYYIETLIEHNHKHVNNSFNKSQYNSFKLPIKTRKKIK